MDVVTLLLACALPSLDDRVLRTVAEVESHASPTYVRAYGRADGINYDNAAHALAGIARMQARAGGAYVGVMGVPLESSTTYEVEPNTLLDACANVRIATALLSNFQADCAAEDAPDRVGCTLIRYGNATGFSGETFAEEVMLGAVTADPVVAATTEAEQLSDTLVFDTQESHPGGDGLHFKLDLHDLSKNSQTKIAHDLDEHADEK